MHRFDPLGPAARASSQLEADRRQLLSTCALFVFFVSLPAPPAGDTFNWMIPMPEDASDDPSIAWYVDWSLFDEFKRVDRSGSLVAGGFGVPPASTVDAAGAESCGQCSWSSASEPLQY